jgi:hypothetical protein
VWLGETGSAQCGGEPGLSDAYVSGFWWVDQLGVMARRGEPVSIRQSLSGANYGLLDDDTLVPRPDYWNSLLWRRLMGTVVLDAEVTDSDDRVRAYAHCTRSGASGAGPGAVTLVAINLSQTDAATLQVAGASTSGAEVYLMTASDLASKVGLLNGTALAAAADGSPPAFAGASLTGSLKLPPTSYAFVVLPSAGAAACM